MSEFDLDALIEGARAQLERVRQMEWNGELAAIPRDGGSSQHGVRPR